MCSQELWELLEHMDDDGAFKTALRDGDPSSHRKALIQVANEIAVLRAGMVPGVDSEAWGSQLFLLPTKLRELANTAEVRAAGRDSVMQIGARTKGGDTP
jgi:hypothetical protein